MSGEGEKVSWNLADGLIFEIKTLLYNANRYYVGNNISSAFRNLKAVKMRFEQTLNLNEINRLNEIENECTISLSEYSKKINGNIGFKSPTQIDLIKADLAYSKYNSAIMHLLETKGFLIEKKKDASRMNF